MGEVKDPHAKLTVAHTIFRIPSASRRGLLFIYTAYVKGLVCPPVKDNEGHDHEIHDIAVKPSPRNWAHSLRATTTIFSLTRIAAGRLRLGDSRHNCIYSGGASVQKCLELDHSI